jgi:hypothetical protein
MLLVVTTTLHLFNIILVLALPVGTLKVELQLL